MNASILSGLNGLSCLAPLGASALFHREAFLVGFSVGVCMGTQFLLSRAYEEASASHLVARPPPAAPAEYAGTLTSVAYFCLGAANLYNALYNTVPYLNFMGGLCSFFGVFYTVQGGMRLAGYR